ncbi:GNAT family N-acetyltransferase [Amorphoplanes nipponensis]|uniref:N-acetyltransferase n=1 Tax=Actinoplanes nipponensis TaxID=135950 RepID=A0A919JEU0_9ACTN|nr:GNAT family N-acetyltransferase [Actinoplanes nipponensis]GIE48040.1 N-acetyltransferase [Actinoplanes nipponensis]
MTITYAWRPVVDNAALDALHAAGFGYAAQGADWRARLERHSVGWVCAHRDDELVGFVNVAGDGGVHAFLVDTVVAAAARGHGVGTALVSAAVTGARAAGCRWLHVDYEPHLAAFYLEACGFRPTAAGLVAL